MNHSESAPAKVNLFLHVGERRVDGYHDLTSLVVFPQIGDEVSATSQPVIPGDPGPPSGETRDPLGGSQDSRGPSGRKSGSRLAAHLGLGRDDSKGETRDDDDGGGISFAIHGPFAKELIGEGREMPLPGIHEGANSGPVVRSGQNLVLRAAHAMRHQALGMGRPVPGAHIVLTKNLPIASGIGGGSADAAATLRILNKMWELKLPPETLHALALTLGSDVPVCLEARPQWMEGRGERLAPGPQLPEFHMVLVNPGVGVPTAPVFQALRAKSGAARPVPPSSLASARDWAAWLAADTRNDLQAPAIGIAPKIADALAALEAQTGCLLARMSGSGATCFGLFETQDLAGAAADAMPKHWWARACEC